MKKMAYILYGACFHLFRLFPVKKKKVVLMMLHNSRFQGNLRYVYEEMQKRDDFSFLLLSKKQLFSVSGKGIPRVLRLLSAGFRFYFVWNYHLATAEYIFLNDNFLPLAYMNLPPGVRVIQLWHGVGAWKQFGLSSEQDEAVRDLVKKGNRKLTHIFVSSEPVKACYAEAFGVEEDKIFVTGIPVTDFYFQEDRKAEAGEKVMEAFPGIRGKKVLLYTPTFRGNREADRSLLQKFPAKEILHILGDEWVIVFRLHPQVHEALCLNEERCYDATEYPDIKGLYVAADMLINDYSSTVVEFALLHKPVYQYAYDLEDYDRGFYWDYREYAPGPVAGNRKELAALLKEGRIDEERWQRFIQLQYKQLDGQASRRVVDQLLKDY